MTDLADNLARVRERIHDASARAGRDPADVTLVAVSKGHDAARMRALAALGVTDFGESYVQEWRDKVDLVPGVRWHFIGHLQSNKVRYLSDRVHLIHSVDRPSVMSELHRRADAPRDVLLQINVGEDPAKFGADPGAALDLLEAACAFDNLRLRGLMTIPPFTDDPEDARPHFRALRTAFERLRQHLDPARAALFTEISMGMSADYDIAIEEGATIIRVGTALLGERSTA